MNTFARTALALGVATFAPLSPLLAQGDGTRLLARSQADQIQHIVLEPIWNLAQMLYDEGLLPESRREFGNVVFVQRSRNEPAADALWMIAEIEYARGNRRRAGRALDQVAREAERHGNRDLQARALLEAAVMYGQINDSRLAAARILHLERLLADADVSVAVRSMIERRLDLS